MSYCLVQLRSLVWYLRCKILLNWFKVPDETGEIEPPQALDESIEIAEDVVPDTDSKWICSAWLIMGNWCLKLWIKSWAE